MARELAAADCGVPFYVALPTPTIDWGLTDGMAIPIEERDAGEVTRMTGRTDDGRVVTVTVTPDGTEAANPAFDVTPAPAIPEASAFVLTAAPNPFNPRTRLSFEVPRAGRARLPARPLYGFPRRFVGDRIDDRIDTAHLWMAYVALVAWLAVVAIAFTGSIFAFLGVIALGYFASPFLRERYAFNAARRIAWWHDASRRDCGSWPAAGRRTTAPGARRTVASSPIVAASMRTAPARTGADDEASRSSNAGPARRGASKSLFLRVGGRLFRVLGRRVGGLGRFRFLGGVIVVGHGRIGQQDFLGLRRLLVDRDAHVVNHVDDILDLLGIDDVVRQVIVDLCVGQKSLFLAAGNQVFELLRLFAAANCCTFFAQGQRTSK